MTERRSTVTGASVALAALVLAMGVLHARDRSAAAGDEVEPVLYLRSSALASRLYLSFDAIAADLYWIRAIQHYGEERRSRRTSGGFGLLEPLVDLATTLDPQFNVAYRFGAILIAEDPPNGPGRPDQAIAILEKGLRANPDRWQYAHDIGFVHYFHTGRFDEAAQWLARAAAMPNAPRWLGPVAALTRAQGGDREGARQLLLQLESSSDGYIRRAAERGLAQLRALDDLDRLQAALRDHQRRTGSYPAALADLSRTALPLALADPTGRPYTYDAAHGLVDLGPDSPLVPLPKVLAPR